MSLPGRALYALYRVLAAGIAPVAYRRDADKLTSQGVPGDRLPERRGMPSGDRPAGRVIWVHAVSVGEAMSILPLAQRLSRDATVVLTTATATSARMVAARAPDLVHRFAPLDTGRAVRRFLDHWRPDLLVLTESELWPRQITEAHDRAIPVALVGARLSDRSLRRWQKLRPLARHMLERIGLILAQDERTALGLRHLGARDDRLRVIGALKTAADPLPVDTARLDEMRGALAGRPVWVAASTHPGEEVIAAEAHRALLNDRPDLLLILVPRHPERGDAIAAELQDRGFWVTQRSTAALPDARCQVYLADTLGELGLWFSRAPVAFVGGSFTDMGGHNPVEPAQLGCHAVTGPHITNAADIYAALVDQGAATVIDDPAQLPAAIAPFLDGDRAGAAELQAPDLDAVADELRALAAHPPETAPPVVLAPNFKRRLSGVTATVVRLVPLQARQIAIRATAPALPDHVPQIPLWRLPLLPRRVRRVWHARRNVEMIGGLALRHLLRKRMALLFTSASQRRHTGLTKWLIARMDAVVATSDKTAAYLDRPATVIRHGIDTDAFTPAPDRAALRHRLGLPDGLLIGCFGRIRSSKGTDLFVDAMLAVLPAHPDATALIMGRATEKDRAFLQDLKARVEAAGLSGRILFPPEVPVHEIADHYAALDLYVAPQRWEGFGLTPLEAMACGVPVIATTVGAFDELVVDGETGALVPPGEASVIADAVRTALSDRDRLAQLGAAARAHVRAHFTLQSEADALIAIYRDLLRRA
ncbi:3-deoxy-D-manno-octulosonic-acid transferase [Palleronia pelagia]|uniref:3-deoxy-D-manno-octulosonic acid transferase n=1 Tax=Palleronia pelagia TaxID=387096 RepID=A0A1H8A820_9RHOB|nr:3-deoxy-D-manno-octulosonic-acid transferase [Palleronia pelagia]